MNAPQYERLVFSSSVQHKARRVLLDVGLVRLAMRPRKNRVVGARSAPPRLREAKGRIANIFALLDLARRRVMNA